MPSPVFIQAVPRSRVFFSDPKAFSETNVEVELCLFFSSESVKNFRVFPIDGLVTMLFVRDDAGVGPFLSHEGLFVFLRSCGEFSGCHSNVFCLRVTWALLAVDAFSLLGVDFGFVWAT